MTLPQLLALWGGENSLFVDVVRRERLQVLRGIEDEIRERGAADHLQNPAGIRR